VNCKYCQKPIGLFRSLKDREYCSEAHKAAAGARSARTLRELGELEYHTVTSWDGPDDPIGPDTRQQPSPSRSTGVVLALLALGGIVLLSIDSSSGAVPAGEKESRRPSWFSQQAAGLISHLPKSTPPVELRHDFVTTSLSSWMPAGTGSGWSFDNGLVRPGALRIWKDSRDLSDYRFQFEGRIDNTSINWAVRAGDPRNYYATKLMVSGRKDSRATELVRFSVLNGKETRRLRLPLPIRIEDKAFYEYEVRAMGDRFVTLVGGKVIDTFRDPRLATGGVGFFSENRERASIRWARVSAGEHFVDKLRSFLTFGLVLPMVE
jgi:hypothetical protein